MSVNRERKKTLSGYDAHFTIGSDIKYKLSPSLNTPTLKKQVLCFVALLRIVVCWGQIFAPVFPPPLGCPANQNHPRAHLKRFAFMARPVCRLARWKCSASQHSVPVVAYQLTEWETESELLHHTADKKEKLLRSHCSCFSSLILTLSLVNVNVLGRRSLSVQYVQHAFLVALDTPHHWVFFLLPAFCFFLFFFFFSSVLLQFRSDRFSTANMEWGKKDLFCWG